jgi:hypothetical protein
VKNLALEQRAGETPPNEKSVNIETKGSEIMPSIIRDAAVVSAVVSIADAGKVRLGGMAPSLKPATVADTGKVRLGGMAPTI